MKESKELAYLKNQLAIYQERLKSFEQPLTAEKVKSIIEVEELIMKNKIWMLQDMISVLEAMAKSNEDGGKPGDRAEG